MGDCISECFQYACDVTKLCELFSLLQVNTAHIPMIARCVVLLLVVLCATCSTAFDYASYVAVCDSSSHTVTFMNWAGRVSTKTRNVNVVPIMLFLDATRTVVATTARSTTHSTSARRPSKMVFSTRGRENATVPKFGSRTTWTRIAAERAW